MGFSVISHKHKPGSKKSPKCHRILFFLFAQRSLLSHSAQRRKKLSAFRCHLILQHHQSTVSSSLRMYNSLVERCFTDCVENFRRKSLDKQEETCVRRCAEKFLKHSMRVGMRFAELNQGAATQD
ncbi:PREDICTED: mitochondrial import inner membrane translocase subunit Tim9 isoform X1 [Nelumbo nucifera]|uniref:Mitochondrial import inner membrane translocase subunit n=1 Tax=Nelumbo nucifera TaxID=4432 RepID=A0A1U8AU46_NELNU|nr:PREDICTED: mitochondrial import inner membrane translocase subunit Tim9 isoform X1 [Nelumbo nucifera]